MGILLVGTSLKFGKGKGPAKKSKGSDEMMMMGSTTGIVMVGSTLKWG